MRRRTGAATSLGPGSLAFDGNREIQEGRTLSALEFALDCLIDDLLDIRSTTTAAESSTGRHRNFARRGRSLSHEAANLSITDSAAMANKHSVSPSVGVRFYGRRK